MEHVDPPVNECPVCGRDDFVSEYGIGIHLFRYCEEAREDDREFGRKLVSGENHPMYGYEMPESTRKAISEFNQGKTISEETRKKISQSLKGHAVSEETREKISDALQGDQNPWFGVTGEDHPLYDYDWSEEQLEQLSMSSSGEKAPWYGVTGEDHPSSGITGEDHPMYGYEWSEEQLERLSESHKGQLSAGTREIHVAETDTIVRSGWEAEIDLILHDSGLEYTYEGETFDLGEITYTPDFICEPNVIVEVKGFVWSRDEEKATLLMNHHPTYEYVVVGSRLPSNYHLEWSERDDLPNIIRRIIEGPSSD